MPHRVRPFRLLVPTAVTSFMLLLLGGFAGYDLYRQQEAMAVILRENLESREVADSLDAAFDSLLMLLHDQRDDVESLHDRIRELIADAQRLSDKERERELGEQLTQSFERYLQIWKSRKGDSDWRERAIDVLETETVPACRKLRSFNARYLDDSVRAHRKSARWTALGMAGMGIVGAAAGVVLGYGVARWLRKSIHQLRVRVQDAVDKLGYDLPPVEWGRPGDLESLHDDLHDLTAQIERVVQELQQREREVWRSRQLASAGQLATGIVHEIRNPLTSIRMLVQANREEATPGSPLDDDLKQIEEAIVRMEGSLRSFLEFARPAEMHRAEVDLISLIDDTAGLVQPRARQQHVSIDFIRPAGPLTLEADSSLLRQALLNLFLNALDAMPVRGTLTVELTAPGGAVQIDVCDTGAGISPAVMPHLFVPFTTSKETGVGLGLVISRRIVEEHGGTLEGSNCAGGGACFRIRLPDRAPMAESR